MLLKNELFSLHAIIDIVEERSIESANLCYFLIVHINYDWVRSLSANLKSVDSLGFDVDFNSSSNTLFIAESV